MTENNKQKILIIGGTGYIGSALYLKLTEKDRLICPDYWELSGPSYVVDTVDLEWFGNFVNPKNIKMDYRKLPAEFIQDYDVVILLAGHSSVPMANNSDPQSTFKNNVDNFVALLMKMKQGQKFIYAGSSSVYNGIPDDNVTEDYLLLNPSNTYDMTKQDLDRYISLFPHIEFYGLRFATVNGVSSNLRTDIMINAMVETAIKEREVKLFNENIRRPILYIDDLVKAIISIINEVNDKRGVYNLSSFNSTAGMIAEGVARVVGVNLRRVQQVDVERVLNSKLPTAYDFSISSKKFEETFNFKFNGTVESIASQVMNNFEKTNSGKRIKAVKYG